MSHNLRKKLFCVAFLVLLGLLLMPVFYLLWLGIKHWQHDNYPIVSDFKLEQAYTLAGNPEELWSGQYKQWVEAPYCIYKGMKWSYIVPDGREPITHSIVQFERNGGIFKIEGNTYHFKGWRMNLHPTPLAMGIRGVMIHRCFLFFDIETELESFIYKQRITEAEEM